MTAPAAAASRQDVRSFRERSLLPVLVCVVGVQSLVTSLGAPLVPLIARNYHVSLTTAQWALTASLLAGGVATPLLGRVADLGRERTVLLGGVGIVVIGSVLAVLPGGIGVLLGGRVLQGVGLALTPVAMAIARVHTPADRLGGAIAALSVAVVTGSGLAHPTVTAIARWWGLHVAILTALVITLLVLVVAAAVVPADRGDHGRLRGSVDWMGAVLLAVATSSALLIVSDGGIWGWTSRTALFLLTVLVGSGWLWVWHTLRTPAPLVDLRLASRPGAAGAHATAVVVGAGVFYLLGLVIVLLQADQRGGPGLGQPVSTAGLILLPYAFASVFGSRLTRMLRRVRQEVWLPIGALLYLCATGLLAAFHAHPWQVLAAMLVAGAGSGCTFAALPGLIVRAVPAAETGSALAFNTVLRYLGFSIGSALVVLVIELGSPPGVELSAAAYRSALEVSAVLWLIAIVTTSFVVRRATSDSHLRSS